MDRLHALVANCVRMPWRFFYACSRILLMPFAWLVRILLGSWQAPPWHGWLALRMQRAGEWAALRAAWVALFVIGGAGLAAAPHLKKADWQEWFDRYRDVRPDRPGKAQALQGGIQISAPTAMNLEHDSKPRPLVLQFAQSVAPLSAAGAEGGDLKLTPALPGKWIWKDARQLEFHPQQEWPIDVAYRVSFGPKALAPHIQTPPELSFHSPRFVIQAQDGGFYQDPEQYSLRKAVFELHFSHPVEPAALEKKLQLSFDGSESALFVHPGAARKFNVIWDKYKTRAAIHSEALKIPAQSLALNLQIEAGLQAARGGNRIEEKISKAVQIPGLYSLDISEVKYAVVSNNLGEPENVLLITAGMAVHEKEIKRALQAWLLPERGKQDEAWSDVDAVREEDLKAGGALKLELLPAERDNGQTHRFKFQAEAGRQVFIRVQKGLKSLGGYQLGQERKDILRIKHSAPELAIMSRGSLMALSGDKKLPLLVRDLPAVRVEIGRLLPQQLQHLVALSQGDMSKPEFYHGMNQDSLSERFVKDFTFAKKRGKTRYESVDFSQYLHSDEKDRRGVFLLTVQGYDPAAKPDQAAYLQPDFALQPHEADSGEHGGEDGAQDEEQINWARMRDRRLVLVTDMALLAKRAADGSQDVFVQSIQSGQPVAGAQIEVWGRNGQVLQSQQSNAQGHVRLPSTEGFKREKAPAVLVAKKGGDLSFLPLGGNQRNLDLSRFDVGGVQMAALPNQIQAMLFSDRGMYRPGDTMHIGIIAKAAGWNQKLNDLPVEAEVIDARGLTVKKQKFKLGAGGMAEFSYATQDSSPTGNYTIKLNLAHDNGSADPAAPDSNALQLGSVTVKVQEFMPDRSKLALRLSKSAEQGWISPQDLKLLINVQNLFGAPGQNRRVSGKLTLTPAWPAFDKFPEYTFTDPGRKKEQRQEDLAETKTDQDGNAQIELPLQQYEGAVYRLHALVKAFEPEGGRSVAAEVATLVSERPFMLGWKADGDLSYVKRNAVRNLSWLALKANLQKVAAKDLRLQRIERNVLSVLVKQSNGTLKYESRASEKVLSETPFALAADGAKHILASHTPGNFAYVIRDQAGLELARVLYSVAGEANVARELDRNAELQLSLNKKDYNPGEEIEISLRAPYKGMGLITIERDKVYAHKWFSADTSASLQKITLPKDFDGNGYVSVQFARDLASDEIYMSPLSYGVAPFAVNLARRSNSIKLSSTEKLQPGQNVKIRLELKQPGRAFVFAVDEGILQVARYQTPDPLKFFFQKRALEVSTNQSLDLILPEFKKLMAAAAPGGDAEGALGKHLNPFKRKTDKPVVFWSGLIDVAGSKELSYTVPDYFNGALRVMAVVVNDDTVASAASTSLVRGDLILQPNAPLALSPGDQVEVGVGVSNNLAGSGKQAPVLLNLQVAPGLEVVGAAQQTIKVNEAGEASTKFIVKARAGAQARLGSAALVFSAQLKGAKARHASEISVRPASAHVTLVQSGRFKGSGEIAAQGNFYATLHSSEIAISSTPWAISSALLQYLNAYPYGCTEQISSQAAPAILLGARADLLKQLQQYSKGQTIEPKKTVERWLGQVRARQSADGGIGMWPGAQPDLFATAYVTHLALEAKERGIATANDLLQKSNAWLLRDLANSRSDKAHWRMQTYAAYLLTRQGVNVQAALMNLRQTHAHLIKQEKDSARRLQITRDLGAVYLAAALQIQKQDAAALDLLKPALDGLQESADEKKNWYWEYYADPMINSSMTVAIIGKHFPQRIKEAPPQFWDAMSRKIQDGYYQTHSSAALMLAIDAMSQAAQTSASGKLGVSAVDARGVASVLDIPKQLSLFALAVPAQSKKLRLQNGGDLPMFYAWSESGYESAAPQEAIHSGLEIMHEYLDEKGNRINQAEIGQEVTVRLRLRATRKYLPQVALVDLLPGGLEPVLNTPADDADPATPLWRQRLGQSKNAWNIHYADIREDRVILYGDVSTTMTEISYKARAANAGKFVVPPAYGEAMYERRIFGRSAADSFEVKAK
ncbi:alpha-2-macroglobulin [Massilia sp. W12]|uniref:alpha-2-macroglobulin family protein n=1 Tax=Massilia sp. W12 TaxID=3126507 RepID=UPI0030D3CDF9